MAYFFTQDQVAKSSLNRTFDDLFNCTDAEFEQWVDDLRAAITKQWDEEGQPPVSGIKLEDMGKQFERICKAETDGMWSKDEQTREIDCLINNARVSIANSFFPNMAKAEDSVSDSNAVSVYGCYASPLLRKHTLSVLTVSIRQDGFYGLSPIHRVDASFKSSLRREAKRFVEDILTKESDGVGDSSLWIDASDKIERRTPRISVKELKMLQEKGLLKEKHLKGVDLTKVSNDSLYRIRVYKTGDYSRKILPVAYRFIQVSGVIAPNNFPTGIARLLYKQYAVDHCKDQKEIVIYDPSMGFGSRALAALSLREKAVHYVGTDPNTENWIDEIGISRYEYLERVFKSHIKWGEAFKGTYICNGSEVVKSNKEFKKLKGKVDFVFTSPPYFSAEIYSSEATQSTSKYKEYDSWRDNFLKATLETCVQWLKPNRYLAFNIADVTVGDIQYPLEKDTVDILISLGMRYDGKLKMVLAKSPSMRVKHYTSQPSTKNFCVVNGKWRKYDPIFIFYKKADNKD